MVKMEMCRCKRGGYIIDKHTTSHMPQSAVPRNEGDVCPWSIVAWLRSLGWLCGLLGEMSSGGFEALSLGVTVSLTAALTLSWRRESSILVQWPSVELLFDSLPCLKARLNSWLIALGIDMVQVTVPRTARVVWTFYSLPVANNDRVYDMPVFRWLVYQCRGGHVMVFCILALECDATGVGPFSPFLVNDAAADALQGGVTPNYAFKFPCSNSLSS